MDTELSVDDLVFCDEVLAFLNASAQQEGENAVQLHGGMGVTEELGVGHYFKRLLTIDMQFGAGEYHLRQFAIEV